MRVASRVLAMCKNIQPDFWSAEANPNLCSAWAYVFRSYPLPEGCFYEAVPRFYGAPGNAGKRPTPGDILEQARAVRDRWESDPVRRVELRRLREARRDARDAALERGVLEPVGTRLHIENTAG